MAVMSSGGIVVGKGPSIRKSEPSSPENPAKRADMSTPAESISVKGERHCGAMSQQRGNSGGMSIPQKFLRLIGYGNPKVRPPGGN
jgi:hypothetical protein